MLATEFLSEMKARGQIQSAQTVYTDADLITIANRVIATYITPKFISTRQRWFQCQKDYTLDGVTRRFRLPRRAAGGRVYDIKVTDNGREYSLNQVPPQDVSSLRQGFYLEDGDIYLTGQSPPTGIMSVFYPIMPSVMSVTAPVAPATISAVGGSSVTVTPAPGNGTYDVVRANGSMRVVTPNMFISTVTGTDNDCGDYSRFQVGDLIVTPAADLSGISRYFPFQDDFIEWVMLKTISTFLKSRGFYSEASEMNDDLIEAEKNAMMLIDPRVTDKEQVIGGMEALGWRTW